MKDDFGIIITTYIGDFYFTKALLASIQKFIPNVPICLIQDGDFSLDEVRSIYNITHVIKRETASNEFVKQNCFRSRCSSLVTFSESPFEKFIYLDSDLVLWGNILKHINIDTMDFIHNIPHEAYSDKIYKEQYFDAERTFKYTESFDWRDCHFFNSGVFIARKNLFEKKEFEDIVRLWKSNRSLLPTDPQSILNVLVFRNQKKGKIKVGEAHLQTVVPVLSSAELEKKFAFFNGEPIINEDTVIHWAGLKPLMTNRNKVFTAPEIYFRKLHLKNVASLWRFAPIVYFYYEEFVAVLERYHNGSLWLYLQRKTSRLFK